ncbi:MAG: hypothetical protein AAFY56_20525, partial [Pseudomonadota bacterium]
VGGVNVFERADNGGESLTLSNAANETVWLRSNDTEFSDPQTANTVFELLVKLHSGPDTHEVYDPVLLNNLEQALAILRLWWPDANTVELRQGPVRDQAHAQQSKPETARTACFFTGGVDSFYSLISNIDEVTDIVYVHGFDVKLSDLELRQQVSNSLNKVAEYFDINLIQIESNLREVLDQFRGWSDTHGAALAIVGHLLPSDIGKIIIPSSDSYLDLPPWGSHPLLDKLWSSSERAFHHDGCEKRRIEKIEEICKESVVLETLRVCWQHYDEAYNCGRCEKCQRTMISLRIVGQLEHCSTFDKPLILPEVAALDYLNSDQGAYLKENLWYLQKYGDDPDLEKVLRSLLKPKNALQKAAIQIRRAAAQPNRILPALRKRIYQERSNA